MMQPIMMFVGNLGYACVALTGGLLAIKNVITIGDIQAFIQYVKNFTQPIQQIAAGYQHGTVSVGGIRA